MAAKGHPWLFVRFVVLSIRMVRRPLEYLQRPERSWDLAVYTSVLYTNYTPADVFPLSVHHAAGITSLHHFVGSQPVAKAPASRNALFKSQRAVSMNSASIAFCASPSPR